MKNAFAIANVSIGIALYGSLACGSLLRKAPERPDTESLGVSSDVLGDTLVEGPRQLPEDPSSLPRSDENIPPLDPNLPTGGMPQASEGTGQMAPASGSSPMQPPPTAPNATPVATPGATPTPPASPAPTATPTPAPTATPVPTPTPFTANDYGTGIDGNLTVNAETVVNSCFSLRLTQGTNGVILSNANGITIRRRLLLWQVQDKFATSANQTPLSPGNLPGNAGIYQIVRVTSVQVMGSDAVLTVEPPVKIPYLTDIAQGKAAQACIIPEYESVAVVQGASIVAAPWNGTAGGIVAFYTKAMLTIEGMVNATGQGFRGGQLRVNNDSPGVETADTQPGIGGGKGEGLDATAHTLSGRGNLANGAGGGNSHNAGGGGGGNGGAGGSGALQHGSFPPLAGTKGMGGASALFGLDDRLVLGGGGGAGQQNNSNGGAGGSGGGAILLFASELRGNGLIWTSGSSGMLAGDDGAGGGGAGGSVRIRAGMQSFTGQVIATGGTGGNATGMHGPGGGGGGGRTFISGVTIPAGQINVSPGQPGRGNDGNGTTRDATAGGPGVIELPSAN